MVAHKLAGGVHAAKVLNVPHATISITQMLDELFNTLSSFFPLEVMRRDYIFELSSLEIFIARIAIIISDATATNEDGIVATGIRGGGRVWTTPIRTVFDL